MTDYLKKSKVYTIYLNINNYFSNNYLGQLNYKIFNYNGTLEDAYTGISIFWHNLVSKYICI